MAVSVLVLSGHVAGCGEQVSEIHSQTYMYTHQASASPSSCHIHTPTCTPPFQLVTFPPTLTTLTILSFPPSLLPQYLPSHIQYSHNTLTRILTTPTIPSPPPSLLSQCPHFHPHYSHNTVTRTLTTLTIPLPLLTTSLSSQQWRTLCGWEERCSPWPAEDGGGGGGRACTSLCWFDVCSG